MLRYEGIEVGTTIKAFDFPPMSDRPDMFIVGEIKETTVFCGAHVYVVDCYEDSMGKFNGRVGHDVYVPMEMSMLEFDKRVTIV